MDLGLNSDSIRYEVALDVLGSVRRPIADAIRLELQKVSPSEAFVKYCRGRLVAIDALQDELTPGDVGLVQNILDKEFRSSWL